MPISSLLGRLFKPTLQCFLLATTSLLFCLSTNAEPTLSKEKKLKAAYLLNFTKFIEWPNTGTPDTPSIVRMCVDDSTEFFEFLRQVVGNKRVGKLQHELQVLPFAKASGCELLYVTGILQAGTAEIKNAVIVADSDQFDLADSAILFYKENNRLRFEIDLNNVKKLDVTFSSELLKLARIK